jgi:tripartite-type tricarboxylate transporter receptor subunit TctC
VHSGARIALALLMTAGAAAGPAQAQSPSSSPYPARPVRLVVPFSPGAAADISVRIVAQELTAALGQQVIVDNRSGAGSVIGAEYVAKAAPDGYTLLTISNTHFVSAAVQKKLPYDALGDFVPVTQITSATNLVVVHPSLPVHTVRDLIALAKAHPGRMDYASSGNGSTQHLTGALFTKMAGIDMVHIPYRASSMVTTDLVSGQVTVGFPGIASMIPLIKAGKLRVLAVTRSKRSAQLPEVPTVAESGLKGYDVDAWLGVAAPKGTPRAVVLRLHGDLMRALTRAEVRKTLLNAGQEAAWQDTPERFGEMLKTEAAKWAAMVRQSGAQID